MPLLRMTAYTRAAAPFLRLQCCSPGFSIVTCVLGLAVHIGMLVAYTCEAAVRWCFAWLSGSCPARLPPWLRLPLHLLLGIASPRHISLPTPPSIPPPPLSTPCLAVYLAIWFTVEGYCYMGGCSLSGWDLSSYGYTASEIYWMGVSSTGNAFDYWSWLWTSEMKVGVQPASLPACLPVFPAA